MTKKRHKPPSGGVVRLDIYSPMFSRISIHEYLLIRLELSLFLDMRSSGDMSPGNTSYSLMVE